MAKESIFNILNNYFDLDQVNVLDLFSGTGNISYEFASRGCLQITAVDIDNRCIRFIKQTAEHLNFSSINPVQSDYESFVKRTRLKFDLIFADPPYGMEKTSQIPSLILDNHILNPEGWLILEHDKFMEFSEHPSFFDHRKYGKVNFTIFKM